MGVATVGMPVTPLPKGLPEVRDWPLEVLTGAFEPSTLPITRVEAMGEPLGEITPSWASAPVHALLTSKGTQAPLWVRIYPRGGGGGAGKHIGPGGSENLETTDVDAEGGDDPTEPFINVDGVDPMLANPWRLHENKPGTAAPLDLSIPGEGGPPPAGDTHILGDSPSNPQGVNRAIHFGANSIYEFDADSPVEGVVGDSPTPSLIPDSRASRHGASPLPAAPPGASGGTKHRVHGLASGSPYVGDHGGNPSGPAGSGPMEAACSSGSQGTSRPPPPGDGEGDTGALGLPGSLLSEEPPQEIISPQGPCGSVTASSLDNPAHRQLPRPGTALQ